MYVVGEQGAIVVCLNKWDYEKCLKNANQTNKEMFKQVWQKFDIFEYWQVRNTFDELQMLCLPFNLEEGEYLFRKGQTPENMYVLIEGEIQFKKIKTVPHLADQSYVSDIDKLNTHFANTQSKQKRVQINRILTPPSIITEMDLKNIGKTYTFDCKVRKGPALFIKLSLQSIKQNILTINPGFEQRLQNVLKMHLEVDKLILKKFLLDNYYPSMQTHINSNKKKTK